MSLHPNSAFWTQDFVNMWTAGHLVITHQLDILYDLKSYSDVQKSLFGHALQQNFSYPPSSLFLCLPLATLPYGFALATWLLGTAAFFTAVLGRHLEKTPHVALVAAVLTPAATMNIWCGQYGFLTGGLFLAAGLEANRSSIRGGFFAALLTTKPHMGILLPLMFITQRRWKTIAWSGIFITLLVAASVYAFGWQIWREYFVNVPKVQVGLLDHRSDFFLKMMPTVFVATRIIGLPTYLGWIAQCGSAGFAIFCCYRVARAASNEVYIYFVAATATFLVIPYAFNYDMTASNIGVVIMLERHWSKLSIQDRSVLIAGFLAPQLIVLTGFFNAPIGPLLMGATLFVQMKIACGGVPRAPERQDSSGRALLLC